MAYGCKIATFRVPPLVVLSRVAAVESWPGSLHKAIHVNLGKQAVGELLHR